MFHTNKQGAVHVLRGEAALTVDTCPGVWNSLSAALEKRPLQLVFDLSEVPLIDSAGLECLLDLQDACEDRGGLLALAEPSELVGEILELTDVASQLACFPTTASAVGSFAK